MAEVIANAINSPTTTLSSSITSGSTTIPVNAPTAPDVWPTTGQFRILIDNELIIVTAASGAATSLTVVTRGVEGTSAASHASAAQVNLVLTQAGLDATHVTSLSKSGSTKLVGDVTLTPGSNVTLTQAGNDISIASSGGGGSSGGGVSESYIGRNAIGASYDQPGVGTFKTILKKVTPSSTGLLVSIDLYVKGNGSNVAHFSVGVLSDNAGVPGDVIATNGPTYAASSVNTLDSYFSTDPRWLTIPLNLWVTAGTPIWLAVLIGNAGAIAYDTGGSDSTGGTATYLGDGGTVTYTAGSNNYSIRGAVLTSAAGGGAKLDYAELTSNFTVTATSAATATACITGNPVSYDGATEVSIEVFLPTAEISTTAAVVFDLYDGPTDLGIIAQTYPQASSGSSGDTLIGRRWLTPSAGSHTYSIRAWKSGGTATVYAGAGGAGAYLPAYMRITSGAGGAGPFKRYLSKPAGTITRASATVGAFSTAWQIPGVVVAAGQNVLLRVTATVLSSAVQDRLLALFRGSTQLTATVEAVNNSGNARTMTLEWIDENPGVGTYTFEVRGAIFGGATLSVFQGNPTTDTSSGGSIFIAEVYTP